MLNPYETPPLVDAPYYGTQSSFERGCASFVLSLAVAALIPYLLYRDLRTVFAYIDYWPNGVLRWWPVTILASIHGAALFAVCFLFALKHQPDVR